MKKSSGKRNDLLPFALIAVGLLLVVGVVVWQALGTTAGTTGQNTPEASVKRVTLADAKAAFDGKTAVFVDVRDPESFQAGHIPGAINIPVTEIGTRLSDLKPDQWIITYCT